MSEIRTETMTVNMGPQHPSTHGVLRLVLELDGEVIQSVMPTIGYLAHRDREDGRAEEVAAGHPARRAHGLPGRPVQQPGVRAVRGKAPRSRDAAAREGHSRPHRGAAAPGQSPDLDRHPRDGDWCGVDAVLRGSRARAADEHQRAHRRLPLLPELHSHRRAARGSAARVPRGGERVPGSVPREDRRVRGPAHQERHLPPAHRGRWRHLAGERLRLGTGRADRARARDRTTTFASTSPTAATRPTTSRSRPRPRATSTRGIACAWPRCARASRSVSRPSRASRPPGPSPATTRAWCRRRRTRSTPRWKR